MPIPRFTKDLHARLIIVPLAFIFLLVLALSIPAAADDDLHGDTRATPTNIELTTPKNARMVSTYPVSLGWNVSAACPDDLVFDVYASEMLWEIEQHSTHSRIANGVKGTTLRAMILFDGKTYHWAVVARDVENGTETASSIGQFTLDRAASGGQAKLEISASQVDIMGRETVYFAALVPDSFGFYVNFTWSFPDDNTIVQGADKAKVVHVFEEPGGHNVRLTVKDELGNEQTETITIFVVVPPPACSGKDEELNTVRGASSACFVIVIVMFIIVMVLVALAAKAKEAERQKKQFAVPDDLYKQKPRVYVEDTYSMDAPRVEEGIEKGFRAMNDEIKSMTAAVRDMIKGERFGRAISIFIVIFAVSTMATAYLQANSNRESTDEYGRAMSDLERANTLLLQAESTIDRDRQLMEEARRYYLEGENLWWKYVQKTLLEGDSYCNEKGDALIAYDNAYRLVMESNMYSIKSLGRRYSVNLRSFDDFVPWDFPDDQIKLLSIDIGRVFGSYETTFGEYTKELRKESETLQLRADGQFDEARTLGEEGLTYTRATTFFSVATSVIGISFVPRNKNMRRFLVFLGIAVYAAGFLFMAIS